MGAVRYLAEILREDGRIVDLSARLKGDGRVLRCWGRGGPEREARLADALPAGALPVLLGSGLGVCLARLAARGPVAVVDREHELLRASGVRERCTKDAGVLWLDGEPGEVLAALREWAEEAGKPLHMIRMPLYLRLDPDYYRVLDQSLASGAGRDEKAAPDLPVWARHPRFLGVHPRVLVLRKRYFLYGEIESALVRLGVPHAFFAIGEGDRPRSGYVEELLQVVAEFRPDFLLTVNHFGLDREGRIASLLEEARLPLASWFVDSPDLILHGWPGQNRPNVAVYSFDKGSLPALEKRGYAHVRYLPLATDPQRFKPGGRVLPEWRSPVSFVGESATNRLRELAASLAPELARGLEAVGPAYAQSPVRSIAEFLRGHRPELAEAVAKLDLEGGFIAKSLVTFSAAHHYRAVCLRGLAPHPALVAGDEGWPALLPGGNYRFLPRLRYYDALPGFYAGAEVNFNCTSPQMKGAVNQRVFDVPACGGFLLTDEREQLPALFEPGREAACYASVEEISEQVGRWLASPHERRALAERARKRVLAQHTYENRLETLLADMRARFDVRVVAGGNICDIME